MPSQTADWLQRFARVPLAFRQQLHSRYLLVRVPFLVESLTELFAQDTLNTFSFAALAFQHNADSIELTIHLDSYGIGDYPFLGDTIIEYPCLTYSNLLQRTCYEFDSGQLVYTSYDGPNSYFCNASVSYTGVYFDDDAPNIEATHPMFRGGGMVRTTATGRFLNMAIVQLSSILGRCCQAASVTLNRPQQGALITRAETAGMSVLG